ncbi:DUF4097 family beta strand repeat-containing protein [Nonomuraea sp. LPB2021202275-12-8]|uniref:DUF4097 family beta strand repeat-containing protein n=1 Tax=Nonomuraea sp. LPB2021202275-12-8 TaxID=3120159 RepID=UPI00300CE9AB
MRAVWRVAGAILTVVALTLSTVTISAGFAQALLPTESSVRTIAFEGRTQLKIAADRGDVRVTVQAGEAGVIVIDRWLRWEQDKPSVSEDWDGRTLRLGASCSGQPEQPLCEAEYHLLVPPETDIEATASTGAVTVSRMYGDVRVSSVSGAVFVTETSGNLWARSGSGSVSGYDLRADHADVEVGAGNVDLSFRTPPAKVRAVVRTSGDITVELPEAAYDLTAEAPDIFLPTGRDPTSPRKISLSTPEGTVTVCC